MVARCRDGDLPPFGPAGDRVLLAVADGGRRHGGGRQGSPRQQARGDLRAAARLQRQHRQGNRGLRAPALRQNIPVVKQKNMAGKIVCPLSLFVVVASRPGSREKQEGFSSILFH